MRRLNLANLISINNRSNSDYVIIDKDSSPIAGLNLANQGNFLEAIGASFYKCKKIIAINLELKIVAECTTFMV